MPGAGFEPQLGIPHRRWVLAGTAIFNAVCVLVATGIVGLVDKVDAGLQPLIIIRNRATTADPIRARARSNAPLPRRSPLLDERSTRITATPHASASAFLPDERTQPPAANGPANPCPARQGRP